MSYKTIFLTLFILMSGTAAAYENESATHIDIPAQPLAAALRQFADQAGLQLAVEASLASGKTSPAIKGDVLPLEALDKLLGNTGLRYDVIGNRTVAISASNVNLKNISETKLRLAQNEPVQPSVKRGKEQAVNPFDSGALEEIVVTARRREEKLQDTPVSITALTAEGLERQQINGTEDLDMVTPGLQFASYAPISGNNSAAQVFIRGIGQIDPTPAVDPGVGIYIDDVYMGRSVGGVMEFRDIAGVQILRGPQGTLFGRNTIGGAVLLQTVDPGREFSADFRLKTGSDNLIEAFSAINLPMADNLAARLSGGLKKRDGYVKRAYDGLDLGDTNSYSLNGKLKWEPTDSLNVLLKADYTNSDEHGSPFVFQSINEAQVFPIAASVGAGCPGAVFPPPIPVPMINDPRCANDFQARGPFTNGGTAKLGSTMENWGASIHLAWESSDWSTLKSITAYRDLKWTGARDADNTPLAILHTAIDSQSTQFSEELQALIDIGRTNGVVGAYYFNEESDDELIATISPPTPFVLNGTSPSRDVGIVNLTTESVALFSQWTFDVTDSLSLSGGIRYTDETKGVQGCLINLTPGSQPVPDPCPTTAPPLTIVRDRFKQNFTSTIGSASIRYRWNPSLMTYASWSQGTKSGGFNQRYNNPPPNYQYVPFGEETANTYEIGLKADIGNVLRIGASAFTTDYKDMQLTYRLGVVPLLFNAGSASISGFETELTYVPTRNLTIDASVGYLHDKIDKIAFIPGTTATVGPNNSLPFTPEWSGHVGIAYIFHPSVNYELTPHINWSYTGSQFFDAANSVEVAQNESVSIINASLKFEDIKRAWSLNLGVENATDELYPVAGNSSLTTSAGYAEIIYSRPRNWYLEVKKSF
ncbi:MAG: TonB-dependent receptor [Steroidobacteraceae bacterium]